MCVSSTPPPPANLITADCRLYYTYCKMLDYRSNFVEHHSIWGISIDWVRLAVSFILTYINRPGYLRRFICGRIYFHWLTIELPTEHTRQKRQRNQINWQMTSSLCCILQLMCVADRNGIFIADDVMALGIAPITALVSTITVYAELIPVGQLAPTLLSALPLPIIANQWNYINAQ